MNIGTEGVSMTIAFFLDKTKYFDWVQIIIENITKNSSLTELSSLCPTAAVGELCYKRVCMYV